MSSLVGLIKSAALLAYKDKQTRGTRLNIPSYVAHFRIHCKVSIASMNMYGDRGSPCFSPRLSLIQGPCTPFIRTKEEEDDSRSTSQFLHLTGKPLWSSIWIR
jgi:hypothetical protein